MLECKVRPPERRHDPAKETFGTVYAAMYRGSSSLATKCAGCLLCVRAEASV